MPRTAPAVALRLVDLDTSIYYTHDQTETCQKDDEDWCFNNFSSLYSAHGCSVDNPSQPGSRLDNCRSVLKRGRGRPKGPSRTRGGKSQGRAAANGQEEQCNANARKDKFTRLPGWRGRTRARGRGSKKGRRSIRSRQKPAPRAIRNAFDKSGGKAIVCDDDTTEVHRDDEDWNLAATPVEIEDAENVSSSERSEFDNDNGGASADEFGDPYADEFSVGNFAENVEYGKGGEDADGVDYDDEYNDEEDDEGVDEHGDYYAEGYVNSDDHQEDGNRSSGGKRVKNAERSSEGESPSSSSSEYSY